MPEHTTPYHYVLTVQFRTGAGLAVNSSAGTVQVRPGQTRTEVFTNLLTLARNAVGVRPGDVNVLFWLLEPEAL